MQKPLHGEIMERIIIADNDKEHAKIIEQMIKRKIKGIHTVVYEDRFSNMMESIENDKVAVVIMAMNVSGVNGLELGKKIREFSNSTQFIFVSSCDYYDFVREALQLGAVDYLLKPINENNLILATEKALKRFQMITKAKKTVREQGIKIEEVNKYIEYSFIYSTLFNSDFSGLMNRYKELLDLGEMGYILNIEIDSQEPDSPINLKRETDVLYAHLKGIVSQHNICVVGPRIINRILVLVSDEKEEVPDSSLPDIKLAAHIIVSLKETFKINVSIGIGSEQKLRNIHYSYEEAVRCLRYKGVHNVVRIRDIERFDISHEEYIKLESEVLRNVRFGNTSTVDSFAELLDIIRPLQDEVRRNRIFELLILAGHEARLDGKDSIDYINYGKIFEEVKTIPIEKIEMWAYQKFEFIINSVHSNRLGKKSEGVRNAIRYMEEYYMEPITLEEISNYVGVTPQHFSKVFKEETGKNYIEWLTSYRMDVAKGLLMEGKQTIKEVCFKVGYNDPNYFSRIFKKIEGSSPSEFLNSGMKSEED